ncbi:MAG: glucose-1-phosphate adenylyltransferase subunit GlgD [Oscillospiraceae bacterium]|nr:glucose-1-phosphate adenylyltransferase subunit GlgD [Oscillospiraceae bacterium]
MYIGLSLSDPHPDFVSDGSTKRTLSAAQFAGRYRLVDFMLSNMVNSGINHIGMVLNSHYQSLIAHIGMGKEWDLARKSGGLTFFPPYLSDARQSVNNEIDGPLHRAVQAVAKISGEYVVLVDSSVVCNLDYRPAMDAHRLSGADVMAIYVKKQVQPDSRGYAVAYDIDEDGRITGISGASGAKDEVQNVSLGAYIMDKRVFLQLMGREKNCGMLRFSKEILAPQLWRLRVRGYEFRGYTAQISSVETFFRHNMEMLDTEKRNELFHYGGRRIFTSRRDSLPTKYGKRAHIENSIIADGCQIEGTVINSVICRNVRIRPGAVVENCVLKDRTVVERHAKLNWMIVDRGGYISESRNMLGSDTYPVYIEPERII